MKYTKNVTDYINKAPEKQIEILELLRKLIHSSISETHEAIKWGIPVFIKTKVFTYLRSSKNHVTLGFYNCDRINDPDGRLEGTGKNMKHLKIKTIKDINDALITEWLKATVI